MVQVCYQHHENNCETGYPMRIEAAKVHPFAKVIYLADQFVHLALKHEQNDNKAASAAIGEIFTMRYQEVDPLMLKALMEIFNYPIPTPMLKLKFLENAA